MADQKNKNFRKRLSLKNQEIQNQLISSGVVAEPEKKPSTEQPAYDPIAYFNRQNSEEIRVKDPIKYVKENKLNEEGDKHQLLGSLAVDEKAMIEKIKQEDLDTYEVVEDEKPVDEKTMEEKNEKMKKRMEKALNENKK